MALALEGIPQPEPLSEEAALASLTAPGRVEASIAELARQWGWRRDRARRALARWSAQGRITRLTGEGGRTVILANDIIGPDVGEPALVRRRARFGANHIGAVAMMTLAGSAPQPTR